MNIDVETYLEADAVGFSLWAPLPVKVSLNYVRHLGPRDLLHGLPVKQLKEARFCIHVDPNTD